MAGAHFFLSAGDPSGDNASSHLIKALREKIKDLEFFGLGGWKLRKLGQEQLAEPQELAVMGFWEVAKKYQFFRKLLYRCLDEIKKRQPRCVILVDYPGFNLRLAKQVKYLGIPVIYYISPQVWAWGKKRVRDIESYVNHMLYILPFEKEVFEPLDMKADFVGHYLLDDISEEYIRSPLPETNTIALLPGSRIQEIDRMLDVMLETAAQLNEKYQTQAVVAGVSGIYDYEEKLLKYRDSDIEIVYDDSRWVINNSRLVLTASGTATLETGIIGRPMVVIYRTGAITYQIARRLVKLDKIALVNLVLGEKAVPEVLQNQAKASNLTGQLEKYLLDAEYTQSVKTKLDRVPEILGGKGASQRAAEIINEYLC